MLIKAIMKDVKRLENKGIIKKNGQLISNDDIELNQEKNIGFAIPTNTKRNGQVISMTIRTGVLYRPNDGRVMTLQQTGRPMLIREST